MAIQPGSNAAASLPHPGHIFEKKYRIQKLLGSGGFARVYLANFEDLGRRVAIKILVPTEPAPTLYPHRLYARFQREATLISELKNPATVTMYDFGRSENGLLYMVFEYVDGKTIEELIMSQGVISPDRTATIVQQVLRSLDEAHAHGILHRDIKPANVMVYDYLDDRDLVKLLDFGIAKPLLADGEGQNLTRDNTLLGTPRYMSPEQIVNEDLSPASDVYSLGLVAFEMVTGEPALTETDRSTIIRKHLDAQTFELPADLPLPPEFRWILEKMVAKQIEQRFSTAKEALNAFEQWQSGQLRVPSRTGAELPWSEQPTENPDAAPASAPSPAWSGNSAAASGSGPVPQTAPQQAHQPSSAPSGFQTTPPAGFGSGQPNANPHAGTAPNFSGGTTSGSGPVPNFASNGELTRPNRTKIIIEQTPTQMTVDVPPVPSPRDLVFVALAVFALLVSIGIFWFPAIILSGAAVALFTARLLTESTLVLDRNTGYEIVQSVLGLDRSSRGPLNAVLRLTHRVDDDGMATVKLSTHDGDRTFARNITSDEAEWVERSVNGFLEASRAQKQ